MVTNHYYSDFLREPSGAAPIHRVIASNNHYDLCKIFGTDWGGDEHFLLVSKGTKAKLGITGLVQSIEKKSEIILQRTNAYGYFDVKEPHSLKIELDKVYEIISSLDFRESEFKPVFEWRAQRVIDRFGDYSKLHDDADIIPEYTDSMNIVKVSESCPRNCNFCTESGHLGMILYNKNIIKQNMKSARKLQLEYHKETTGLMDEGFFNSSDLFWFYFAKQYLTGDLKTNKLDKYLKRVKVKNLEGNIILLDNVNPSEILDPLEITEMFNNEFPEVIKRYAFMGVPTINAVGFNYLQKLNNRTKGINRALIGIESADNLQSRLLGKNEIAFEKAEAIQKVYDAGYKVKAIIMVGMLGREFYHNGIWISSHEGLERTVEFLAKNMKSYGKKENRKVLVSKYKLIEGTLLKKMWDEGKVIPFSPEQLDEEIEWFMSQLRKSYVVVEPDYEIALEKRKRVA